MARKGNGMVHGPATPIATIPAGYKSSHGSTYDGDMKGPLSQYPRTKSKNAVPEKTMDSQPVAPKK